MKAERGKFQDLKYKRSLVLPKSESKISFLLLVMKKAVIQRMMNHMRVLMNYLMKVKLRKIMS